MNPKTLLAKTPKIWDKPAYCETLAGHLDDVFNVAATIMAKRGRQILTSMGLAPSYLSSLEQAICLASYLHDLGKANSQFQRALLPGNQPPQALRHEWISVWLPLKLPDLDRSLFSGCSSEVRLAVLFAVLGHHLKLENGAALKPHAGSEETSVTVFCDHADFHSCLVSFSNHLKPSLQIPVFRSIQIDLLDRPLGELRTWFPEANLWYQRVNHDTRRFIAIIKALLIAADVAGSALPKMGGEPEKWTERVLDRVCSASDLSDIADTGLEGKSPRQFQNKVAESKNPVTFSKAGCGSGKTIAAYLWAASRAQGRKLFFCYPTTGTATEGFRDYIVPAELSLDALLLHSRSECDLEYFPGSTFDLMESLTRHESLITWDIPLIICTVDQVLGVIQNYRRPLFSFPTIGNAAFVFDEIHQYDSRLFSALLSFLDIFRGAPILLMTASLPESRRKAIENILAQRGEALEIIEGPVDLENIPRYILNNPVDLPPWEQIEDVLRHKGKILWVANTVDRCADFVEKAKRRGFKPLPYHSRYRYCDRLERHNAVIEAFKTPGGVLAITTQVCEVSLNISADLLITDLAPVPASIQRLGRLNRWVTVENPGSPKPAIFLIPASSRPYEKQEIKIMLEWLQKLNAGPVSQATLTEAFESLSQNEIFTIKSAWLEGGLFSAQQPLREAEATIPVILTEDEEHCIDEGKRPVSKEITRYSIPMLLGPVSKEIAHWKRLSYAFIAPSGRINYSKELGARWSK